MQRSVHPRAKSPRQQLQQRLGVQEPPRAGAMHQTQGVGRTAVDASDMHAGEAVEGSTQPVGGLPTREETTVAVVCRAVEKELRVKCRNRVYDTAEADERGVVALKQSFHVVLVDERDILLKRL